MLIFININIWNYCYCLVTKSCLTLCDPMNCSTSGFPDFHHLLGFAQTHVHWVSLLQYVIFNSLWYKRVWGTDFFKKFSSSWGYFCMFLIFISKIIASWQKYWIHYILILDFFVFLKIPLLDMLIYSALLQ